MYKGGISNLLEGSELVERDGCGGVNGRVVGSIVGTGAPAVTDVKLSLRGVGL